MNEKKEILIVGAGGFGREIFSWIKSDPRKYFVKGFLDSNLQQFQKHPTLPPILGSEDSYNFSENDTVILGVGDINLKEKLSIKLSQKGVNFFSYIHHTSYLVDNVSLGKGVVVGPNCCISNLAKLGDFITLNANCVVGHDTCLGEYSVVSPMCGIMGFSTIGNKVFLGAQVIVGPQLKVGNNSIISANSTVLRDIPDNSFVSCQLPKIIPKF